MQHQEFILTPIRHIVENATYNMAAQNWGIETYPIMEHYFSALYLKVTGASEQKLKCVCWDMATDDYEYRYQTYSLSKIGECSCYEEKQKIVNDIYHQILKINPQFDISTEIDKNKILTTVVSTINTFYNYSGVRILLGKEFKTFENYFNTINIDYFLIKNQQNDNVFLLQEKKRNNKLIDDDLMCIFNLAYRHRNRCAHNTLSYQENQVPLSEYQSDVYKYENYFFYYAIMILIDEMVISLYKKHLEVK